MVVERVPPCYDDCQALFESTLRFEFMYVFSPRFTHSVWQKSLQPAIRGHATLCSFGKSEMVSTIYSNVLDAQGWKRRTPHSESVLKTSLFRIPSNRFVIVMCRSGITLLYVPDYGAAPQVCEQQRQSPSSCSRSSSKPPETSQAEQGPY